MGWTANYDNDGFADLAIGAPFDDLASADNGLIAVVYGSSGGLSTADSDVLSELDAMVTPQVRDYAGLALASGRLDGNPYDDLLIGIPGRDFGGATDCGAMMSCHGRASGLIDPTAGPFRALTNWFLQSATPFGATNENLDLFGAAVAVGDFNGTGPAEAAIGAPGESLGSLAAAGAVFVGQIPPGS
ncbi:MAG: hypothetical protein AAF628_25500 [Planctomycetota bacterium]